MARHDLLETRLTWSLPYFAFLVVATLACLAQVPRPVLREPQRQLVVGYPRGGSAPVTDPRHADVMRPPLTRCGLFDLSRSDDQELALWQGDRVARESVGFEPDAVSSYLKRFGVEPSETDLEVDVLFPNPGGSAAMQMLVVVHPYRLLPPATWDTYLYDLANDEPKLLLARRDEPARLNLGRTGDNQLTCGHEAMSRRNRCLVFTNGAWCEARLQAPANAWLQRAVGAFTTLPWWGWLAALCPLSALAFSLVDRWERLRSIQRRTGRHEGSTVGLLCGAAALAAVLAGLSALRRDPAWDLLAAATAPVLIGLSLWLGVAVADASAARYAHDAAS